MRNETPQERIDRLNKRLRERLIRPERRSLDYSLRNESWSGQEDRLQREAGLKEKQRRNEPGMLKIKISGRQIMKIWGFFKRAEVALACLLLMASCTQVKTGPFGMQVTSFGGDIGELGYAGTMPQGNTAQIVVRDPNGSPMMAGGLYMKDFNNSKSFKTGVIAAAAALISNQWAGVASSNIASKTTQNGQNVAGATSQAEIAGGVEKAGIAADVQKAEIAAGVLP